MLRLNALESISKKRKRVGRGSDRGGTSGKGHKGQRARSGAPGELKAWFEGGQMSLTRRLPRRGFTNRFKKEFAIINLQDLEKHFSDGDQVNVETLYKKKILKRKDCVLLKILGNGELHKKLQITAHACSKSAAQAIEKSGGKIELVSKER
jgi:large subunit ribosomal protein L15